MTDKDDRQGKINTGKIGVLKPEDGNNETELIFKTIQRGSPGNRRSEFVSSIGLSCYLEN